MAPGAGRVEVVEVPVAHRALEVRVLGVLEHALEALADSIGMADVAVMEGDGQAWVALQSGPT